VAAAALLFMAGTRAPAVGATLGRPGVAVPLYVLDGACADRRFPQMAGAWALGCVRGGQVDRAVRVTDGREVTISPPLDPRFTAVSAGIGPGSAVLVEVAHRTRVVDLDARGAVDRSSATRLPSVPVAPPATSATHFAAILEDQVEALAHDQRVRHPFRTAASGWYAPALAWPIVAWVERTADGDENVWMRVFEPPEPARPLAQGPGFQRHVVSDGRSLAWVEPGGIHLWDPPTDTHRTLPADTGFHAPPTLSEGVVCWEERRPPSGQTESRADIDIVCSDGLRAEGPGHQLYPSRSGPWLLYRSDEHTWLLTAP